MPYAARKHRILSFSAALLCAALCLSSCTERKRIGEDAPRFKDKEIKYYLALGIVLSPELSEKDTARTDFTAAALLCDKGGRIKECLIDCAENCMNISNGTISTENTYTTNREAKNSPKMKQFSAVGKEWYEQADRFSEYIVGMSLDDIERLGEDAELSAGCTVSVTDMQKAVIKALEGVEDRTDTVSVYDEAVQLRLAAVTDDRCSKSATEDSGGIAAMYTVFCTAAVSNGRADAVIIDEAEPQILFNPSGEPYEKLYDGTKREQKKLYGMAKASSAGKEWYEQTEFLCRYISGMSADEMAAIGTDRKGAAKDADLYCGCTVAVDKYLAAAIKALRS